MDTIDCSVITIPHHSSRLGGPPLVPRPASPHLLDRLEAVAAKVVTLPELEALAKAMLERCQLMVPVAARCGLPFGEITELRRTPSALALPK